MTPCRFFYPCVVIEFYNTMTSRLDSNPKGLHFSIDGHEGILRTTNIAATFNLLVPIQQSTGSGPIPHPGKWYASFLDTHQLGPFDLDDSFHQGCSLMTIYCDQTYFRSNI